jgi:uncharacterized protein with beta-barrel porin domain
MKNRFDPISRYFLVLVCAFALAGHASAQLYWSGAGLNPATAGPGTWNNANSQWSSTFPGYTAAVWNTNTANFNGTGGGTVTLGANITALSIVFGTNAGAFTLNNSGANQFLDIIGAGITNNSANTQTITNSGLLSATFFDNSAAGNTVIINSGTASVTQFSVSATAANATITNSGTASQTQFIDSATAGNATITNSGSDSSTRFNAGTTAGNATINNTGMGTSTRFNNGATAGNATITNSTSNSLIDFNSGNASAGNAIINNNGTGPNSFVQFNGATAANATINNNGAGARVQIDTGSTAANATITNSGAGSILNFTGNGSGGAATLINANATAEIDLSFLTTGGTTAGSIAGNGFINLGSKNFTVGGNNTSTTFSGVIQDGGQGGGTGGSLTKVGTGTLILSGTSFYTGATNINAGVLQVDGLIFSFTTVNTGGTLSGSGTIGASLFNHGLISPGSPGTSLGTLSAAGSYGQDTGILRIQIGGLAPAQHDLLSISSAASLGGTLQLVQFNNFMPMNGDQVVILTANAGRTGQFSSVTDNFQGLIRPHIIYDPNDVRVVFSLANSFASQALTPNQEAVANNLDDAANDPAAAALIGFLGHRPLGNLPHDYDLIAPEELAAIYEVGFSQSMVQNNNLERRMDDIRAGANGFCANNFVATTSGKDFSKDAGGKVVLPAKDGPEVYIPTENNRWGVFVNGSGNFVNVGDDDSNAPGYEITTGNFTLGADYRVCDHFAIGINGGYANSQADLVNDGRVDVDGGKIGVYATVFGRGFFGGKIYIDGAIGGGLNSYETLRIGLQDELVRGDTDGSEFNGMISYGSDWTFGCFNIGTWSTIQYTRVNIDEFTELGSLAPLEIQDQSEDSLRSTSGIRASYDIKAGRAIFRPELRVAWQHEHGDRGYQVDSRFASGAGGIFRVHGPEVGKDAALIGTGLSLQWNNRFATYVYYDGVLGRGNYDNSAISGGLRVGF